MGTLQELREAIWIRLDPAGIQSESSGCMGQMPTG